MSRSDRGEGIAALAVAIAVTLGVALFFALARPPLPPTNNETGYHNHAAKCADADGMYRRFLDARVTDAYPSYYEEEDAKRKGEVAHWCDLAAQELTALAGAESAYFTRLGAIATVAAALFLIIALIQTRAMLREAKDTAAQARLATNAANRTTAVTRNIGVEQTRAHLAIFNINSEYCNRHQSSKMRLFASLEFQNVGKTPCRDISITCNYLTKGNRTVGPIERCETLKAGDKDRVRIEIGDLPADQHRILELPIVDGQEVPPELVLFIRYRTSFGYFTLKCRCIRDGNYYDLGWLTITEETDRAGFWTVDGRKRSEPEADEES